jgi:uncharacterized protein YydD (DUF2326 family)
MLWHHKKKQTFEINFDVLIPEIPRKFSNVVLEKDGNVSWTDREKNEEVLHSQGGKEHPAYNKQKEGYLDWSHIAYSKTRY